MIKMIKTALTAGALSCAILAAAPLLLSNAEAATMPYSDIDVTSPTRLDGTFGVTGVVNALSAINVFEFAVSPTPGDLTLSGSTSGLALDSVIVNGISVTPTVASAGVVEFFFAFQNMTSSMLSVVLSYTGTGSVNGSFFYTTAGGPASGNVVPGPVAGAGIPALIALGGFLWARRRNSSVPT